MTEDARQDPDDEFSWDPEIGPEYSVRPVVAEDLMHELDRNVIGQASAKRTLSHAVAMHTWRLTAKQPLADAPNVMVLGPTGSGKTLSATIVANLCGVPFVAVESASLVPSGIVGMKLEHIAEMLWVEAEKILVETGCRAERHHIRELAGSGIVFLDEFDKLAARTQNESNAVSLGVQRNLLRFVEGMSIHVGEQNNYSYRQQATTLDTSRVLFIAAGAFAGVEEMRTKRVESNLYRQMFGDSERVVPEDIKNFGFLPELVGRFQVMAAFAKLSPEELAEVLRATPRSPLPSLEGYARSCGVALKFTDLAITAVAKHAGALGLGARGLQQLLFPLVVERIDSALCSGAPDVTITEADFQRQSDLW